MKKPYQIKNALIICLAAARRQPLHPIPRLCPGCLLPDYGYVLWRNQPGNQHVQIGRSDYSIYGCRGAGSQCLFPAAD
jgi:hypothetical protein